MRMIRFFLQKAVNEEEVWEAVTSMGANKTPGGDGLPSEFFKLFWEINKRDVVEGFSYMMRECIISESERGGSGINL